jgi:hypothetical protein
VYTRNKRTGKKGEKNNHGLKIKIYNENVPIDDCPKFLGIKFDKRLTFKNQIESIQNKVIDRISILKILSYDRHMRLNEATLIKIYKILVRSVIDYSCLIVNNIAKTHIEALERIQNNCLRAIYKINPLDHITNESLREKSSLCTIEDRLKALANRYLNKAVNTQNPLVNDMIDNYCAFRNRFHLNPSIADSESMLNDILAHNREKEEKKEKISTIFCGLEFTSGMLSDEKPWT